MNVNMKNNAVFGSGINIPLFRVLKRLDLKNKAILSLGCGLGSLESLLEKKYGCNVFGVDYDSESILIARKKINRAIVLDLENGLTKSMRNRKFDIILFADILEHLRYPEKLLIESKQLLSDKGIIVASIPNIANWFIRLKLLFGKFEYENYGTLDKTHIRFYTQNTAKKLIENAGLKVAETKYSTSFVNIIYGVCKKRAGYSVECEGQNNNFQINKKRGVLRKLIRLFVESADEAITYLFPNLFAYQFIIVARKKL